MGTFDNSISALKSKLSKIAEATRALSGSTKKLSLDEIPNVILQNTGTFCYYLGQGTSFNIKSLYPTQYMNFTVDNFIVDDGTYSVSCSATYGGSASTSGKLTKSYNKSTGVFTVGGTSISCGGSDVHNGVWSYGDGFSDRTFYVNGSASRSPKVWVVSSIRTAGEANYCYYLGTLNGDGQINVKSLYPNIYQNFTINDFIICACTVSGSGYGGYNWNSGTETSSYSISAKAPSATYSNGILTISGTSTSGSYSGGRPDNTGGATVNMTNIKIYLVSSINYLVNWFKMDASLRDLSTTYRESVTTYTIPRTGKYNIQWSANGRIYADTACYINNTKCSGTSCIVNLSEGNIVKFIAHAGGINDSNTECYCIASYSISSC